MCNSHVLLALCHYACPFLSLSHSLHPHQSLACLPGTFLLISSSDTLFSLTSLNSTGVRYSLSWNPPSKPLFYDSLYFSLPSLQAPVDTGSLPFPEPGKLFPSQGLYTFFSRHLDIISRLHFVRISTQIYCWTALLWFSCLIQKFLSLLSSPPLVFFSCCSSYWGMCIIMLLLSVCPTGLSATRRHVCLICSHFHGLSLEECLALSRPSVII